MREIAYATHVETYTCDAHEPQDPCRELHHKIFPYKYLWTKTAAILLSSSCEVMRRFMAIVGQLKDYGLQQVSTTGRRLEDSGHRRRG